MKIVKENLYLFPIIGGFLAIIALFFPTSFHSEPGYTYYVWMSQIYLDTEPALEIGLLRTDLTLVVFSTIFSVIIYSSAIISIILSIVYQKHSINSKGHKKFLIILATLIALSTVAWILMMEVFYRLNGGPHWNIGGEAYTPHFGVIGQFIGSFFIVMGVLLERNTK